MRASTKWPTQHYFLLRSIRGLIALFCLSLIPPEVLSAGSKGTDFWFAFPQGNTLGSQLASVGIIISGPPGTTGSMTVPGAGQASFTLDADGYKKWTSGTISLSSDTYQTSGIDAVGSRFVNITASVPVSVQVAYEVTYSPTPTNSFLFPR